MDAVFDFFGSVIDEQSVLMLSVLIFLATATLAFGIMAAVRVRGSVRRRLAGVAVEHTGPSAANPRSLRHALSASA